MLHKPSLQGNLMGWICSKLNEIFLFKRWRFHRRMAFIAWTKPRWFQISVNISPSALCQVILNLKIKVPSELSFRLVADLFCSHSLSWVLLTFDGLMSTIKDYMKILQHSVHCHAGHWEAKHPAVTEGTQLTMDRVDGLGLHLWLWYSKELGLWLWLGLEVGLGLELGLGLGLGLWLEVELGPGLLSS